MLRKYLCFYKFVDMYVYIDYALERDNIFTAGKAKIFNSYFSRL